jgi:hypothetical protein
MYISSLVVINIIGLSAFALFAIILGFRDGFDVYVITFLSLITAYLSYEFYTLFTSASNYVSLLVELDDDFDGADWVDADISELNPETLVVAELDNQRVTSTIKAGKLQPSRVVRYKGIES